MPEERINSIDPTGTEQVRCICNKLIAITKGTDIEIRCNKCKRYICIKTEGIISIEHSDQSQF